MGKRFAHTSAAVINGTILAFCITACGTSERPQESGAANRRSPAATPAATPSPVATPMTDEVVLTIEVLEGEGGAVVKGETNLPQGTELMISVSGESADFMGQDKTQVGAGGTYLAGPFGPARGLKPGGYWADVTMPIARIQPAEVRAVIGAEGEWLRGPGVEKGQFGVTVKTSRRFNSPLGSSGLSDEEVAAKREAVDAKAAQVFEELRSLEAAGRAMEPLRQGSTADLARCGEMMRKHQATAEAFRARAEALPRRYATLHAAAIELSMCVSCKPTALEQCDLARENMQMME